MWQAIWQVGPFIIGVAAAFALFMGALFLMERSGQRRRQAVIAAQRMARCAKRGREA